MSSFLLRALALCTMFIDHAGLALFPDTGQFRCLGRIAFPLYCFLLVQGYRHTHDRRAYARRLTLLAFISEVPFDLLTFGRVSCFVEQNALFSLLLSLLALYTYDCLRHSPAWAWLGVSVILCAAMALRVSYGWLGIALCLCAYLAGESKKRMLLSSLAALLLYTLGLFLSGVAQSWALISLCALAALPLLALYSGRRGLRTPALTFLFYAAYPLHMAALIAVRALRIVPPYFFS